LFEGGEGATDWERRRRPVGVEEGSQQAVVELAVEDGDADAFRRDDVAVAAGEALDQPVRAQPAQIVAHLAGGVLLAEQSGDVRAKALVAEAGDGGEGGAEAPARAVTRESPKRSAPVRWPSRV
jgi:hypothetical protein